MSSVRAVRVEERRVVCALRVEMWDWVWAERVERGGCCCGWGFGAGDGAGRVEFR